MDRNTIQVVNMGTFTITQTREGAELFLQPNADGCNIDLTPVGDVLNYECIDDAISTPDDDTTYVYSAAVGLLYDLYGLPNHTTEAGTINYVEIYARAKSDTDAQAETGIFKIILTENACANVYKSNDINLITIYASYSNIWTTNPRTATTWSWSDIDNLQAGLECNSPEVSGAAKTLVIRPSAAGDITQCAPRYCPGVNYTCVDELAPNNFTDFVSKEFTSGYDLYNLTDHTTETGVITKVSVFAYVNPQITNNDAKTVIKTGGNTFYGALENPPGNSWTLISTDYTVNPDTTIAWTWADIDALQAGIWLEADTSTSNTCTQVYVVVYYLEDINPEIRTTQVYAKVNYDEEITCLLNMPKQVSIDHQQNIKMLNFWSGNRAVYGLSRSKRTMVLTGTQYGENSCAEIECVRAMGVAGDEVTLAGLGSNQFDKTFRIISFGWRKISNKPLTMDWILELEYAT